MGESMEWEVEELYKLNQIQPDILEVVLKELWQRNPALYKSVIINAYLDEKINLGKAAELIGVHRLELQNELRAKGVPIRGISKEDAIAEVEAIREWRKKRL
jgi:predicted HTH domain antitoxin